MTRSKNMPPSIFCEAHRASHTCLDPYKNGLDSSNLCETCHASHMEPHVTEVCEAPHASQELEESSCGPICEA